MLVKTHTTQLQQFHAALWEYYRAHGRHDLPWRIPDASGIFDPYKILVSEIMLQQTQVVRVMPKYEQFLAAFPTVSDLAAAPLGDVLKAWQGLGYNRRAKYLWEAAHDLAAASHFPSEEKDLVALPGVGKNTAGAIRAYAFNLPALFVETNIRTVFLHHFAGDAQNVPDSFIRDCLRQTLDSAQPRLFYWALMDYGAWLKTQGSHNAQSKHYAKQSAFSGSKRQVRGAVVRHLSRKPQTYDELAAVITDARLSDILAVLVREGMIRRENNTYYL